MATRTPDLSLSRGPDTAHRSPNFTDKEIPVSFVVIHYTAASMARTIDIFMDPVRQASSHLVIDVDGTVHEFVPCLTGPAKRAWHAGKSRWAFDAQGQPLESPLESFNDFAVGIELVNPNGNIVPYAAAQCDALIRCLLELRQRYPGLASPHCLVGHEQIAGFRGKCDPGRLFDWGKVFSEVFPGVPVPVREPRCSALTAERLKAVLSGFGLEPDGLGADAGAKLPPMLFEQLSSLLEAAMELPSNDGGR